MWQRIKNGLEIRIGLEEVFIDLYKVLNGPQKRSDVFE